MTVAMNGEIYNYEELRRDFNEYPFITLSDTEVLLAVFTSKGIPGFKRLRGTFATVVIDQRHGKVYLLRDPVGKKPLYVLDDGGDIVFGSSVLAVMAASGRDLELDQGAVDAFWRLEYVPPDRSVFKPCRPLFPGEVLEYDWSGQIAHTQSCRPESSGGNREATPKIEVNRLLTASVRRRLHNNPHPQILLSGGIDSTVVAQTMHRLAGGESLTLASRLRFSPDERYARHAARRIGLPLHDIRVSLRSIDDDVVWALSLQDEPLGMISFFMLAHLIRAAKVYGRILLTGDGGDEVFLGYGRTLDWTGATQLESDGQQEEWNAGPAAPPWMSRWGRFTVREQLLGHMLPKIDRAASEQGVETRCPLLDWDLMEFARTLPPQTLLAGGRLKALLESQLQDWPDWFIERPKVGFTFHLRWLWLLRRYGALRELVSLTAVERFEPLLPGDLRGRPNSWSTRAIFENFKSVWKLLAWSEFERRLSAARPLGS